MKAKNIVFSLWPVLLLSVFFLISLVTYISSASSNSKSIRFFYYPDNSGQGFGSEVRAVPKQKNLQSDIHTYIEELLLGPINLDFSLALPAKTKVKHVLVSGNKLYINFPYSILSEDSFFHLDIKRAVKNLEKNIRKNFRDIEEIYLSIEGKEVFFLDE